MKLYKISEKVAKETAEMLQAYIKHIDNDCAESGCLCDLRGSPCSSRIRIALHNFESGLCLISEQTKGGDHEEQI